MFFETLILLPAFLNDCLAAAATLIDILIFLFSLHRCTIQIRQGCNGISKKLGSVLQKFHKVISNPSPENTTIISKRSMNETLALTLAQTGRIFVSNMNRSEAWRTAKTFTNSIGIRVKQFAAQHMDEKGNRYDGYEFVIIQDVPITSFGSICPSCGEVLVLKCGRCGKSLNDAISAKKTA
jgi:hypothetical protein